MKTISQLMIIVICLCSVTNISYAEEWGEVREATANLNVREKRSPQSRHILTLSKGQKVKVDFENGGWFAVFDIDEVVRDEKKAIGYANANYLVNGETLVLVDQSKAQLSSPMVMKEGAIKAPVAEAPELSNGVGVDTRSPVKITSDRMTYDESGKVVSFVGNVIAEHGELTLWAQTLSAYLASQSDKSFSADSIDRIVAEGRVKAQKGKSQGTCGKLTYYVGKQLLQMEDNPKLQDGPNSLSGEVINFYIRENRSEVVGGDNTRVKAIFMTPDNIKVQ